MARPALTRGTAAVLTGEIAPGAGPDEQDGLVQAGAVADALGSLGMEAVMLPVGLDLGAAGRRLLDLRPEVAVNLVDAILGQGRLVHLAPGLLDSLGIPYTGCPTEAVFCTSCKPVAKRLLAAAGIPTPPWLEPAAAAGGAGADGGRWIVKSVWEHASIGIDATAVVDGRSAMAAAVAERRRRFGGDWFAERFVDGREFNVSLLAGQRGPVMLPPAEICFVGYGADRPRIVDYAAKWQPESFEYRHTERSFDMAAGDRPLIEELRRLALACWQAFGLNGYARVDFRVDDEGRPWVLEVNANPCISPDAGFVAAAARAGLSLVEVVAEIVRDAVARAPAFQRSLGLMPEGTPPAGGVRRHAALRR